METTAGPVRVRLSWLCRCWRKKDLQSCLGVLPCCPQIPPALSSAFCVHTVLHQQVLPRSRNMALAMFWSLTYFPKELLDTLASWSVRSSSPLVRGFPHETNQIVKVHIQIPIEFKCRYATNAGTLLNPGIFNQVSCRFPVVSNGWNRHQPGTGACLMLHL